LGVRSAEEKKKGIFALVHMIAKSRRGQTRTSTGLARGRDRGRIFPGPLWAGIPGEKQRVSKQRATKDLLVKRPSSKGALRRNAIMHEPDQKRKNQGKSASDRGEESRLEFFEESAGRKENFSWGEIHGPKTAYDHN